MFRKQLASLLWEFSGTFFLAFIITIGATRGSAAPSPIEALAFGWTLSIAVYSGGPVSGGHYNPAVTLGAALRGAISWSMAGMYMVAQFLGAFAAGGFGIAVIGNDAGYPSIQPGFKTTGGKTAAFWSEVLYTMLLVLTVLSTATAKATKGNQYFGLAIGSSITVGALSVGDISGAALNPAVGLALPIVNGSFEWIYLVAPFIGAIGGWAVFTWNHPDDVFGEENEVDRTGKEAFLGSLRLSTRPYVNEAVGTGYLVMTIGLAASTFGNDVLGGLGIGFVLMIAVYLGGHVSGGHYNPAVTLGVWLSGKMDCSVSMKGAIQPAAYVISQLTGGFIGAGIADGISRAADPTDSGRVFDIGYPFKGDDSTEFQAVLGESIITFFLVTVVLFTACSEHSKGNAYFGFCIGMVVFVGASSIGPISGGAFNPAVGTCLPVVSGDSKYVWIYWVGPLCGALAAAFFYNIANPDNFDVVEATSVEYAAYADPGSGVDDRTQQLLKNEAYNE